MARTPEGKVKDMVKTVLAEFSETVLLPSPPPLRSMTYVSTLYEFWPVPSGFGASSLDCIVCYYGRAIYIETKAPSKTPTPRQDLTIAQVKAAGGIVFVIDGEEGCKHLRDTLLLIRLSHANNS